MEEARPAPLFFIKEFGYRCLLLSLDKVPEYSDVINLIQTDESERSGRGVPLIIDRYGKDALAFRENAIVISIPFRRISDIDPSIAAAEADKAALHPCRRQILKKIRATQEQLMSSMSIGKTVLQNNIRFLKKKAYITRVSSNKKYSAEYTAPKS